MSNVKLLSSVKTQEEAMNNYYILMNFVVISKTVKRLQLRTPKFDAVTQEIAVLYK